MSCAIFVCFVLSVVEPLLPGHRVARRAAPPKPTTRRTQSKELAGGGEIPPILRALAFFARLRKHVTYPYPWFVRRGDVFRAPWMVLAVFLEARAPMHAKHLSRRRRI